MRAVVFDLGGVVLGSPLHVIADYEAERGIPLGTLNRVVSGTGPTGSWSRHERGELSVDDFAPAFEAECATAGVTIDARHILASIEQVTRPRPEMYRAIERIRKAGLLVAALTNNFEPLRSPDLTSRFDLVVQSSVEGVRKPDPRIYEIVLERLGEPAPGVAFLDDIGANLKPARALGMTTIKVDDPAEALAELAAVLGFPLS
jgi:putative hydrolase of the HAD superfamily